MLYNITFIASNKKLKPSQNENDFKPIIKINIYPKLLSKNKTKIPDIFSHSSDLRNTLRSLDPYCMKYKTVIYLMKTLFH